jgi:hypothetical protein
MGTGFLGAAARPVHGAELPDPVEACGAADEAAVMNLLRVVNRAATGGTLTPVERAFVLAARTVFAELERVCGDLLAVPPGPAAAARRGNESTAPATGTRPARRRPSTRTGSPPE